MKTYTKQELQAAAVEAAKRHGITPAFYLAQIEQESGWNPKAKSSAGALGLAQFMPDTAKAFNLNPLDPIASLDAGAKYMAKLTKRFGSEDLARQAYNWGEGNLAKHLANPQKRPMPKETAEYNSKIYVRAGAPTSATAASAESRQPAAMPAVDQMGNPTGQQAVSTRDAAALAMAEINQGLPAGALGPASMPDLNVAAAPQGDWQQRLAALAQPVAPVQEAPSPVWDSEDFGAQLKDQAVSDQNRLLANMLGDPGAARQSDTVTLPASVDRYLDKLLA